jgi:hypothetical protein
MGSPFKHLEACVYQMWDLREHVATSSVLVLLTHFRAKLSTDQDAERSNICKMMPHSPGDTV